MLGQLQITRLVQLSVFSNNKEMGDTDLREFIKYVTEQP